MQPQQHRDPTSRRVAIVTGSARGIGAAIAAIRSTGGEAVGVGADVTSTQPVEDVVTRIADELGPPTVLVNNAGILRDNLIFKMTDDDWDAVMAVQLRVNAIAPGFIATDMLRRTAERLKVPYEQLTDTLAKDIPVGRVGQPDDIAHATSFFCSEGAAYVSGQVLYVAGGPKA